MLRGNGVELVHVKSTIQNHGGIFYRGGGGHMPPVPLTSYAPVLTQDYL